MKKIEEYDKTVFGITCEIQKMEKRKNLRKL